MSINLKRKVALVTGGASGIGAALVRSVHGSVTNVIGLPIAEVVAALREVGGPRPRFSAGSPA